MPVQRVTLSQFARICATLEPRLRRAVVRGLQSAAQRHAGLIVEEIDHAEPHPAVDTNALRNSVFVRNVRDGAVVEVQAPHAGPIDRGTRPFFPPIQPLAEWAARKGLAASDAEARSIAFAIARVFAVRGIAPRHFMAKAWARLPPFIEREVSRELRNEATRGGRGR